MTHTAPATFTHPSDPPVSAARQQHAAHLARLARLNGPIKESPVNRFNREEWLDQKVQQLTKHNLVLEQEFKKFREWATKHIEDLHTRIKAIRVAVDGPEKQGIVDTRPGVMQIRQAVCRYFELLPTDLDTGARTKNVTYPRHIVMYLCRTLTLRSFPEIGRLLGKRDHTTVLHGYNKIARLVREDWTVAFDVAMVEQML